MKGAADLARDLVMHVYMDMYTCIYISFFILSVTAIGAQRVELGASMAGMHMQEWHTRRLRQTRALETSRHLRHLAACHQSATTAAPTAAPHAMP